MNPNLFLFISVQAQEMICEIDNNSAPQNSSSFRCNIVICQLFVIASSANESHYIPFGHCIIPKGQTQTANCTLINFTPLHLCFHGKDLK